MILIQVDVVDVSFIFLFTSTEIQIPGSRTMFSTVCNLGGGGVGGKSLHSVERE